MKFLHSAGMLEARNQCDFCSVRST